MSRKISEAKKRSFDTELDCYSRYRRYDLREDNIRGVLGSAFCLKNITRKIKLNRKIILLNNFNWL